ncbi:MAG: hypothetical protein HY650_15860 [Acidobacteria bacterium]|nr:hypothetical protein [Acidobacteriota bacterium]
MTKVVPFRASVRGNARRPRTRHGLNTTNDLQLGRPRLPAVWLVVVLFLCAPVHLSLGRLHRPMGSRTGPTGSVQATKPSSDQPSRQHISPEMGEILEQTNTAVDLDPRLFAVMAALNVGGYDYESPSGPGSPLRETLRADLARIDSRLRDRLRAYYRAHRLVGVEEPGQVARYVALSFLISPPPSFAVGIEQQDLPEDVVSVLDFVPLLREFYESAGLGKLMSRYAGDQQGLIREFREEAARTVFETINYLHTRPMLVIHARGTPRGTKAKGKASAKSRRGDKNAAAIRPATRIRERRLYVLVNPLDARDSAYVRNDIPNGAGVELDGEVGDDYLVAVGPSREALASAVRIGTLRFALEPLGELHAREIRSRSEAFQLLYKKVTGRETEVSETAFSIATQSLSAAAEARMKILSVPATEPQVISDREDDALNGLCQQYQRGAILAFHFYDKLIPWERVGVDIAGYYEEMIRSIQFGREFDRISEVEALRARLEKKHSERSARFVRKPMQEQLTLADALIQGRKYAAAKLILEELLKTDPEQTRTVYGLAQVMSGLASEVDPARAPNPDTAQDQIVDHLLEAVKLYQRAAERARPPAELWIASQARVAAGRILDYFGERAAAVVEYRLAVDLGPVAGGAYGQAREGMERPLTR